MSFECIRDCEPNFCQQAELITAASDIVLENDGNIPTALKPQIAWLNSTCLLMQMHRTAVEEFLA